MAFFHRKLFPFLTSTTNETVTETPPNCTDFCDPLCGNIEECYSYQDPVWVPPLPAPPLPPGPPPQPVSSNIGLQISPVVIIVIIVLVSAFLVITYYAVVAKFCNNCTRALFRRNRDPPQPDNPGDRNENDDFFHDMGDQDPVVDHPIWLISTIGLQQSVINSITMIRYKKEDGLIEGTDCSVCLSEFQENETLRLLPKCNHAFHIDCIDTWLRSHTNCPLCRAAVVVNSGRPSLASNEASFRHSGRPEVGPMEESDSSDVELGNSHIGNSSGVSESRGVTGQHCEVDNNTSDQNKAEEDSTNNRGLLLLTLVRRSFSMDYRHGLNSRNVVGPRSQSPSSSRPVPAATESPAPMKRSYSWSERVFWSSHNQNRNSDLAP